MINFSDFLIVYLTCGAPLGVFYFLQNRKKQFAFRVWLKTFFTFVFWLPFGWQLLTENDAGKKLARIKVFSNGDKIQTDIFLFQKQFEDFLEKSKLQISIFEFREIFERYVGLAIAGDDKNPKISDPEKEIFRISNNRNCEIGAICLNRRNLKRLAFHQIQARQDFFQIISQLSVTLTSNKKSLAMLASDFFQLLNDTEAQLLLERVSFDKSPVEKNLAFNRPEDYLWNTEIFKQKLPAKSTALHLQTLTRRANSSTKD